MSYAAIHPDWEKPRRNMADGYSLEMTAKELDGLREAAPLIRPNTQIAVTFPSFSTAWYETSSVLAASASAFISSGASAAFTASSDIN